MKCAYKNVPFPSSYSTYLISLSWILPLPQLDKAWSGKSCSKFRN